MFLLVHEVRHGFSKAIPPFHSGMALLNPTFQSLSTLPGYSARKVHPVVVAGRCNIEDPTHQTHGELFGLVANEIEYHDDSLAKKAVALF